MSSELVDLLKELKVTSAFECKEAPNSLCKLIIIGGEAEAAARLTAMLNPGVNNPDEWCNFCLICDDVSDIPDAFERIYTC